MIAALAGLLERPRVQWLSRVDERLSKQSWDMTWAAMQQLIDRASNATSVTGRSGAMEARNYDWVVVGAGFAGAVLADRLARIRGERVLVVDRRDHIGGNAYDGMDAA